MLKAWVIWLLEAHDVRLLLRPHTCHIMQAGRVDVCVYSLAAGGVLVN